jgi:hypothetical protein
LQFSELTVTEDPLMAEPVPVPALSNPKEVTVKEATED